MKPVCHQQFVGIDVSKEWIDVATYKGYFHISQNQKNIDTAIKQHLLPIKPLLCVLENTGGYERLLVKRLRKANLKIHIAHPLRVREFASAKGFLAKTDRIDSGVLSAYGEFIGASAITPLPTDKQELLTDLQARYKQIKAIYHAEQCRIANCANKKVKAYIKKSIAFFKIQMEKIESEMQSCIEQDDELIHRQQLLYTMKGVGKKTAREILINLPELGQISRKKIAALVGVAPATKQSGKKENYAKIRHGRNNVRSVLYMSALVASQHNPVLKKFYEHLIKGGKPPKVALVAVMRKLIVTLNAMVRDNLPWRMA